MIIGADEDFNKPNEILIFYSNFLGSYRLAPVSTYEVSLVFKQPLSIAVVNRVKYQKQ